VSLASLLFFFVVCYSEWTRNLITEGIEPNPGPRTLLELIEKLKGCYKDPKVHNKLDQLLVKLSEIVMILVMIPKVS